MATTQISAYISEETKVQIEQYAKKKGLKKAFLIEEALLHHLQVLREIPEDIIIPTQLLLSDTCMKNLVERLQEEEKPNKALKELMRA